MSPTEVVAKHITESTTTPIDSFVTTRGEVAIDGKTLHYTAQAGQLPVYNSETGELAARVFIVAYTADRVASKSARPLTFIWNGGPGSNSWQVHLQAFGPKIFATPPTYPEWREEPIQIADNPDSWLAASDLVFVDPVGTGYSRPVSERYRDLILTGCGDAEAVARGNPCVSHALRCIRGSDLSGRRELRDLSRDGRRASVAKTSDACVRGIPHLWFL